MDSRTPGTHREGALTPGTTFAGYRIESLIGRGGMGVVYRARDVSLDRPVALKLIAPELSEDERFRARFLRESRLAASLDHPHVVPIHEAGERDGQLYLAMRYVEGGDLRTLLDREGKLSPERALGVLAQIADALDAAHRRGLVHRDVKPGNVLLDDDGHAYLSDFGITKQVGGASTDTGRVVGTLDYLAPEQIRGEAVDGRADGYALACVLYECLSGAPPFRRETEAETLWAHMQDEPPSLPGHPDLDPVLRRALAKDNRARHATCGELLASASLALGFEPPARRARRLRIGGRLLLAGGLLLVAAAAAVVVPELTGDRNTTRGGFKPVSPDSVAVLDPESNRVVDEVRIPGGPGSLAAAGRSVWVASDAGGTISAIDGRSLSVERTASANAAVMDITATEDAAWIIDARRNGLLRVDAAYGSVANSVALTPGLRPTRGGVDVGLGAVWVTDGTTRLLKLDREDGAIKTIDVGRLVEDVVVGAGSVWAVSGASSRVIEIDPRSGSIRATIPLSGRAGLTGPAPIAIAAGEGAVWVLNGNTPSVTRIDPELASVAATIPLGVGSNPSAIAAGAGSVWVALTGEGALARIDPDDNSRRSIPVGGAPTGVTVGQGRVWVSVQPGFRARLTKQPREVRVPGAVEQPFCTPVEFAGNGKPQYLIVSDLPLQLPRSNLQPLQYTDAIRYVLARHDFQAGRYRLGYQSCDDSSVRSGERTGTPWTPATCRRSARAYSAATSVIGVIGPYQSGCASFLIPLLNTAREGPLATISATATAVGLTRDGPGALPGEPERYYPRGVRHFARVVAADDVQGAAAVLMARRLNVTRLYVLDDGDPLYGIGVAKSVVRTAGKLGVAIAGSGRWDVRDPRYRELARRIERSGADGVFLGGYSFNNGAALLRDLRAALGPGIPILAPDGFSEFRDIIEEAGADAEGLFYSVASFPPSRVPPSGQRFADAFQKAVGGDVDPYSITTAQAVEVLLDAVAASDGTRASVTEQLLKVRVKDGILGSFEFDANGDTTSGAVTMYRIERGRPRVRAVITPPAELVGRR